MKPALSLLPLISGLLLQPAPGAAEKTARQWEPVEWRFENPTIEGNPFDLVAKADFRHAGGGEISTELFFEGGGAWVLRFTGTVPGKWSFTTRSGDPDLEGLRGEVTI